MSDLNLNSLDSYLKHAAPEFAGVEAVSKFSDGQSNPTYLVKSSGRQYVLRRQPFGKLLKSAHAVDREYRVIDSLHACGYPVPQALHLCTDPSILGSMFYLMSYVSGRVYWDPTLPELNANERATIYTQMNSVMARLHDIDVHATGLESFGKPGNYFARQIERWTQQYRASETEKIVAMDELIRWLPENLPVDDAKVSLIHGDFRLDNLLFDSDTLLVSAVLDWELSTLGHPFADLAYQCMQLRMPNNCVIPGLGGIDRNSINVPSEEDYVSEYCNRRNIDSIPNWNFYLIFSFFRFAAILQGVNKRALSGNASSEKALEYGALAPTLADMATELI